MKYRIFFLLACALCLIAGITSRYGAAAQAAESCGTTQTYTVQAGDNLGKIAWKFGVSLSDLISANNLEDHNDYFVGQQLIIPAGDCQTTQPATACGGTQTYTVQAGDNLGKIAWKFGVSLPDLISANNLKDHTDYFVGQQLIIPSSSCQPSTGFSITQRERFGVTGALADAVAASNAGLQFGSFVTWGHGNYADSLPQANASWQMIRLDENGMVGSLARMDALLSTSPGQTWIIGNEPDVIWQDNLTPSQYATHYHTLYQHIKAKDPTAQVAIAGVSTPTPLRRAYLDQVLQSYKNSYGTAMPIDVWTLHAYILREERNSWGAEIPPGMPNVNEGSLYEIEDHNDVAEMSRLITDFRVWMAGHGYQDSPLAITEIGLLMPADFGFPPEVVTQYMHDMFNFMLKSTSPQIGFSEDGNRLVQWWFWYNIHDGSGTFTVSDLYNADTNQLTQLGWAFSSYLR